MQLCMYALVVASTRYSIPFLLGYELGVMLLPMAHGWQHITRSRFGPPLAAALTFFEKQLGLLASKAEHHPHHVHVSTQVIPPPLPGLPGYF